MTSHTGKIEPLCVLLCDDLRQDAWGTDIIVGAHSGVMVMYPDSINQPSTDRQFFQLDSPYKIRDPGNIRCEFEMGGRVVDRKTRLVVEMQAEETQIAEEYRNILSPKFKLFIRRAGELIFRFRQNQGKWKTLRKIRVKVRERKPDGT